MISITKLLIRLFIKDYKNTGNPIIRTRFGILSSCVGIALNVLLCTAKFIIGTVTNSIAITVDAANNLSDAGSSIVNLLGFKLAGKPADKEHPFGHGRLEYVSALIVSIVIMIMGFELVKTSFEKILHPEPVVFSWTAAAILVSTMLAKLWLATFYRNIGNRINSPAMSAVVVDSLSDIGATGSTLVALIVSAFTSIPVDGYIGLLVAVFVFSAGIGIIRDTIGPLLGEPPEAEFVKSIAKKILSFEGVVGIHDLMLHNYGPGRTFGSVHAEVPSDIDIMKSHDTIDLIERAIERDFGISLVIHLDPIAVDDDHVNELRDLVTDIVTKIDEQLAIHDFRVVEGPTHTNLIFDLVTPHKYDVKNSNLILDIGNKINEYNNNYFAVITAEHSFI